MKSTSPLFSIWLTALTASLCLPGLFAQEGTMRWSFDSGGAIVSAPAIGDDNTIYFGSNSESLYALQPTGELKWSVDIGADIRHPPVVAPDGTIYVGENQNGLIIATNPDGTNKWTFDSELDTSLNGVMALAADGTLYAGIGSMAVAINPNGTQFWTYDAGTSTRGIAVGQGGVVAISDGNSRVHLLDSMGNLIWDIDFGSGLNSSVIFGEDGTLFYTAREVIAIDPKDGSELWRLDHGTTFASTAAFGTNGDLLVPLANSASDGGLVSLDPSDGSENWTFTLDRRVDTTPAVGLDGTIYIGTDSEELIALNPDGSERWRFQVGSDVGSSPAIADNGDLYFGSDGGNFFALKTSSPGLAATAWPKLQRDNRNTGQAGSDITRRRFFSPQVFYIDESTNALVTIRHTGSATIPAGLQIAASFRIDVLDRDGGVLFSIEESVEPGETKDILLEAPDESIYQGAVVIDSPIKDGQALAPFLTWNLEVSEQFAAPLRIGSFFSDPRDANQVHYFPAEASETNGLGIAVQNIGENSITCDLQFLNADGSLAATEQLSFNPLGSFVGFFNDSVPEDFKGSGTLSCDAPVVAVSVNQDFANGAFPTDRLTIKGLN